ncbi:hypothetical protein [Saccharibacillus qingshengii]|uniref:hypothetical protein n=1 Tax=Saccharibacillus qingshengii TaxID=1763540 RepID=UPI00155319B2|nr:hypothetical protein [Saccharibacillus qingshengii]
MHPKKLWIPAAACMLALTACSPTQWANKVIEERVIQVKRYPDQQKPYVGYASAFKGYTWKKGEETTPKSAWEDVPEAESIGDPNEIDISPKSSYSSNWSGLKHKISGKSLASLVERAAAYEYKHQVSGIRIDSSIDQGEYTLASFGYRYKEENFMGIMLTKREADRYVYQSLNFSWELTDEGRMLPFVPGTGAMSVDDQKGSSVYWLGGTVNDERIKQIVMHFDNVSEVIPIEDDQLTYLINDERGANGESDRELQYIEGLDQDGKAVYTWQY